jgi:hypothetical protein
MDRRLDLLKGTIGRLAASPEVQIRYLDSLFDREGGASETDELALEFDDAFSSHQNMVSLGVLTTTQVRAIEPLDKLLDSFSGPAHADFWTRSALVTDARWDQIRSAAAVAIAALN